jgi:hypothetical protein
MNKLMDYQEMISLKKYDSYKDYCEKVPKFPFLNLGIFESISNIGKSHKYTKVI